MTGKEALEVFATVCTVVIAFVAFVFVVDAFIPEPVVAQNLCGNSCLSSADCMKGCVCMDDEGDGLGVCVSFN